MRCFSLLALEGSDRGCNASGASANDQHVDVLTHGFSTIVGVPTVLISVIAVDAGGAADQVGREVLQPAHAGGTEHGPARG